MDSRIKDAALKFGDRILRNKLSSERIAALCGVSIEDAADVRKVARALAMQSEETPDEEKSIIEEKSYVYNEFTGTYIFAIPGSAKPLVLSKNLISQLVTNYSNSGYAATLNECSRSLGLSRGKIVAILRALGITHDSLPWTSDEMSTRSDEDLIQEASVLRQEKLYQKIERDKWRKVQEDAAKWAKFETNVLVALENTANKAQPVQKISVPTSKRKFIAMATPTDFHHGRYGDTFETGETYNREIGEHRLMRSTETMLADVLCFGKPEFFLVGVGSDFFNFDNEQGATTNGTPQDNDGNPTDVLATGCQLMVKYIDSLRQVAPVKMVLMSGNHDKLLGVALLLYLKAWYRSCDDVQVVLSAKPRQYTQYGDNFIAIHHGDGLSKAADLARAASVEQPVMWGNTKHRVCFTGHMHHEKVEDHYGFLKYQLPSLCSEDRYHALRGYTGSRKNLAAVLIDHTGGIFGTVYGTF